MFENFSRGSGVIREWRFSSGVPGDRGEAGRLRSHDARMRVIWSIGPPSRRCLEAALVNGAERVLGPIEAIAFERKLFPAGGGSRKPLTSLRRIQEILHACNEGVGGRLEVRKVSGGDKASFRSNAFRWLAEEARGAWIVRLVESGIADHCVWSTPRWRLSSTARRATRSH